MGELIDLVEIRKAETDNLIDTIGMQIVEFLGYCKVIKHRDVPGILRELADTWLGKNIDNIELPF